MATTKRTKHTAADVPTYVKDHEIHAARAMHGASYDRLVAAGKITAPSREELPDAELNARIAKVQERRASKTSGKTSGKTSRTRSRRSGTKRPARKASTRTTKKSVAKHEPASDSGSSTTSE